MVTKTNKQKKPYRRTGKTVAAGYYPYPKRYELLIEPNERGVIQVHRTNENFNAYELYGHLRMILLDVERQLSYSTENTTPLLEKIYKDAGDNHAKD